MNFPKIAASLKEMLIAGYGSSTLLQLFEEDGITIAHSTSISRGRVPQKGEKVARIVDGKTELFVVFDGFHMLVGNTLTEVVNAKLILPAKTPV